MLLWPILHSLNVEIGWAHTSFRWSNLASNKATVTVVIVCLRSPSSRQKFLYDGDARKQCSVISPYLIESSVEGIGKRSSPFSDVPDMKLGNMPYGKGLLLDKSSRDELVGSDASAARFIRRFAGGEEFLHSKPRFCLWIEDDEVEAANSITLIKDRIDDVREQRLASTDESGRKLAARAHQFRDRNESKKHSIVLARTSSENREYLPAGLAESDWVFSSETFVLYDASLWCMAILSSRVHLIWIATVCGKLETRYRYSNTIGWNTFPVPKLTEKNKDDMTRCAEDILLAREAHFPATIADLYDPEKMPADLRAAHDRNDETLERIYIGRRFRNDTERLEKLFELYTKMTTSKDFKQTHSRMKA